FYRAVSGQYPRETIKEITYLFFLILKKKPHFYNALINYTEQLYSHKKYYAADAVKNYCKCLIGFWDSLS
ncbi:MAG: hypothetical protein AAFO07_28010, partial [Bacteroidota bacterium]